MRIPRFSRCALFAAAGLAVVLLFGASGALAQDPPTDAAAADAAAPETPAAAPAAAAPDIAVVDTNAKNALVAGHNAWMLTSCALVLFMTAPGLAMFYGGLVRKKNVLNMMMMCFFLMALNTVVWALWGYSLAFGGDPLPDTAPAYSKWIGNDEFLLMKNVGHTWDDAANAGSAPMEGAIPRLTHMLFQGMFFIITPALICGAFAERMKFSTMVVFTVLWGTLIYCPLCHWVWDNGILAYTNAKSPVRALDFAGGTVVHISSGVSALVCALLIGKRLGFPTEPMPPHNLTYTVLGAAMLWVGWFGFNAGSELASDSIASSAFAATHFAAAAGALAWAAMEWLIRGKPSALGAASGAVAGLVCITPASGYVTPMSAILMGLAAGVVCYLACTKLKSALGYDDSLDAFGVHGVGGTLGALLTGVFATRAVNDVLVNNVDVDGTLTNGVATHAKLGLLEGGTSLFMGQLWATLATWGFALVGSFILLKVLDAVMGLRVSSQDEIQGLDLSQHGEEGYIFY